jgi:GNAT superfamily N-acetyltransferase
VREIKKLDSNFSKQINALVSKAFGYLPPHTFFDDFPVWDDESVIRLGILENQELISHVGVRLTQMKTSQTLDRVALIGAVATDARFRGQGLSTSLLREAIQISENQNCSFSILWGSEHEFYAKLGFTLQGVQARAPLSSLELNLKNFPLREIKTGLTEKIFKSLGSQKNGIALTEKDRSWFFQHKTVHWFYLEEPFAFVGYERGLDLPQHVHEFGGDIAGIQKILFQIFSAQPNAQIIGTHAALAQLGFLEEAIIEEHLCLARPHSALKPKWNDEFWISGLSAC